MDELIVQGEINSTILVFLVGGDISTQSNDIGKAKKLLEAFAYHIN